MAFEVPVYRYDKHRHAHGEVPQAKKRLLVVEGALHGIFAEPEPTRAAAETAVRQWVRESLGP